MAGKPAYHRPSYKQDIRNLRARGWTWDRIARHLGMSRMTLWRILNDNRPPTKDR